MLLEVAGFAVVFMAGAVWVTSRLVRGHVPVAAAPLYLLVAAITVRPTVRWGNVGLLRTVPELGLLAAAVAASAWVLWRSRPLRSDRAIWLLGAFALLSIPGWIASTDPLATLTWWVRLLVASLALATARQALTVAEQRQVLRDTALWLLLAVVVAVVVAPQTNLQTQSELPFFDASARFPTITSRDLGWIGFGVLAWGAFISRSRAALVAFAGIALMVIGQHRAGLGHILLVALLVLPRLDPLRRRALMAVAALGTAILIWPTSWSPLYGGGAASNLLAARRALWRVGLGEVDVAPWFGRGMNSVVQHELRPQFDRDYDQIRQIHNTWLDVFLGSGVFATVILAATVVVLGVAAVAHARKNGLRGEGGLAVAVIGGAMIESMLSSSFDQGAWILFAVLLVVPLAGRSVDRSAVVDGAELGELAEPVLGVDVPDGS